MALTDIKLKSLVAKDKAYSVADSEGLQIEVLTTGIKVWRYRYRLNGAKGKQEKITLGRYPEISLSEARLRRSELKRQVINGVSPAKVKQEQKKAILEPDNLSDFAINWVDKVACLNNKKPLLLKRVLEVDILPIIGNKRIQDVTQTDILKVTDKIKERGADSAALLAKSILNRVFDYAISREKIAFNPAKVIKSEYIGAVSSRDRALSKEEIALLMKVMYGSSMTRSNKLAIHLLVICLVRKTELLNAKWNEINLELKEWHIPSERMKKERDHIIYLPNQAIDLFSELKQIAGHSAYVLPSNRDNKKPIASNTLNYAVKNLNLEIPQFVLHDFRRTASTHLHETGFNSDVIEKALAHEQGGVRGIYNKAEYKDQRKEMLQTWANFIDSLMTDNKVILGCFGKKVA